MAQLAATRGGWINLNCISVTAPIRLQRSALNLRVKSLLRGTLLVLGSLVLAFVWAGYPEAHANPRLILPAIGALAGTADTLRCLRLRWSFYHGGVILLLYMDIMALAMILFLLLYPYDGGLL